MLTKEEKLSGAKAENVVSYAYRKIQNGLPNPIVSRGERDGEWNIFDIQNIRPPEKSSPGVGETWGFEVKAIWRVECEGKPAELPMEGNLFPVLVFEARQLQEDTVLLSVRYSSLIIFPFGNLIQSVIEAFSEQVNLALDNNNQAREIPSNFQASSIRKMILLISDRERYRKEGFANKWTHQYHSYRIDPSTADNIAEHYGKELKARWNDEDYDARPFVQRMLNDYPYFRDDWVDPWEDSHELR